MTRVRDLRREIECLERQGREGRLRQWRIAATVPTLGVMAWLWTMVAVAGGPWRVSETTQVWVLLAVDWQVLGLLGLVATWSE